MSKSKYDVVILGAGHNGLVAASYLGRAGLSVLVLEKNDYIGGATTSQRLFPDYDVGIFGAGHHAPVAASYLGRAGLSVLVLEKNDYIGGATTSQRLFPDYDARLSRYSYLVSLFPDKIIR